MKRNTITAQLMKPVHGAKLIIERIHVAAWRIRSDKYHKYSPMRRQIIEKFRN